MGMKPINFSKVIEASGLSKKEIANRKGIKPETLSRHISGAIRMTLDDAWEYSEILNCLPQEVFFPSQQMPILGSVEIKHNPIDKAIDTIFSRNLIEKNTRFVWSTAYKRENFGAFLYENNEGYNGRYNYMRTQIDIVDKRPVFDSYVSEDASQTMSYVCLKYPEKYKFNPDTNAPYTIGHNPVLEETDILVTMVYPQPNKVYTLFNPLTGCIAHEAELTWATPIIATATNPSLLFEKVDF